MPTRENANPKEHIVLKDLQRMFCQQSRYSMLINQMNSCEAKLDDDRETSILADHSVLLWAINAILKLLATPVEAAEYGCKI